MTCRGHPLRSLSLTLLVCPMTLPTELTLFVVTTLFGSILSLVCLPWQTNNINISFALLSSWLLVGFFVFFVNSLAMNTRIWCDICAYFCNTAVRSCRADTLITNTATKLMVGAYIGVPASMLCVLHHLYTTISAPNFFPEKVRAKNETVDPFPTSCVSEAPSTTLQTRSYVGPASTDHRRP
jgi:hypothetical protein